MNVDHNNLLTKTITDDISLCNSYLEDDKTTKNVKKEKSYIKVLLDKPIVKKRQT